MESDNDELSAAGDRENPRVTRVLGLFIFLNVYFSLMYVYLVLILKLYTFLGLCIIILIQKQK
jgi:hypothetical protein